ncbi:unnamed protein product [Peronospora destructor]|uniref:Elicitin n=1 Tax=Peronospora destructor TaxID=86335 RepID=A0AAV0V668_9STRA|nr:unnamed protein product [Peronospora destructor]
MQFSIFLFVLLAANGAVAEDACPSTEIMKLAKLYANPNLHECQKISGDFSIASPTDPQVKAMCTSDPCRELIKDVLALKPADCYVSFAKVKVNAYKVASTVDDACMTDMKKNNESWKSPPALKPIDGEHYRQKQEAQKYVKDTNGTHVVKKDADAINSTATELFPMSNTTLPANV